MNEDTWRKFEWSYCYLTRVDLVCWNLANFFQFMQGRPMQPIQLHWAPLFWGPRAMVFG